jgi:hypothetical protein
MYLLSLIYSDKGCYLIYDENLSFDVADILGNNLKENNVNDIVQGCIKLGLFDESLFKNSNILTSAGIQRRYVLAKRNAVIPETIRVIADETGINTDDTDNTDDVAKNVLNNPKSRVRAKTNKKVNKRNVFIPPTLDEVVGYFITEGFTEAAGRKAGPELETENEQRLVQA